MKNIDLVENGLNLLKDKHKKSTAVSTNCILQRYDAQNSKLAAYLMAELEQSKSEEPDVLQLFRTIEATFNESELQGLCFELHIDYEDLNGRNRLDKIRELITYMKRRHRLPHLVERCAKLRPDASWQTKEGDKKGTTVRSKLHTAVVVDIARPALRNVAAYLDNQNIEANFVVFRHQQPGQFFKVSDDWEQLSVTFGDVMDKVKRRFNGSRIHFFMAGPGGLLFAMGCIWGTVDEAVVYHYEENTYHPVLEITRSLRNILTGW